MERRSVFAAILAFRRSWHARSTGHVEVTLELPDTVDAVGTDSVPSSGWKLALSKSPSPTNKRIFFSSDSGLLLRCL